MLILMRGKTEVSCEVALPTIHNSVDHVPADQIAVEEVSDLNQDGNKEEFKFDNFHR